jgi:transketolase
MATATATKPLTTQELEDLARLVRYYSLVSTTKAGSGHPTSSMSAADLMTVVFFNEMQYSFEDSRQPNNDRVIFSKGHASPLLYSLYTVAGAVSEEELMTLRKFGSRLEGHPTSRLPWVEAATGSLGQGLSIGVGEAISGKYLDRQDFTVYVLLGDGEMAEGSVWEAFACAANYKLDNLIAIVDVNRLGQSQPTAYQHDIGVYAGRVKAFGWHVIEVDGHDMDAILRAFAEAKGVRDQPVALIANTIKGKGAPFIADQNGWHGKALSEADLKTALEELGPVNTELRGGVRQPPAMRNSDPTFSSPAAPDYKVGDMLATRRAYGNGLKKLGDANAQVVALDGDVKNSTYSEIFQKAHPDRFFEMFIAEQNMVGVAVGLARMKKRPFVSTFAAFFTRAYDQIRMGALSEANMVLTGSHAGVSIGEDGASQMGLEELAMMRAVHGSTVLYPSDAVATERLLAEAAQQDGVVYIQTTRADTPVIYRNDEQFPIGGAKVVKESDRDVVTVVGAGITLAEAVKAYDLLQKEGIAIRVVDAYSVKPIDAKTISASAHATHNRVIVVEDHWFEGGLGDAVLNVFATDAKVSVTKLAVTKTPHSGKPAELLAAQGIDANSIAATVRELVK